MGQSIDKPDKSDWSALETDCLQSVKPVVTSTPDEPVLPLGEKIVMIAATRRDGPMPGLPQTASDVHTQPGAE